MIESMEQIPLHIMIVGLLVVVSVFLRCLLQRINVSPILGFLTADSLSKHWRGAIQKKGR